jgi:hypothetical protein
MDKEEELGCYPSEYHKERNILGVLLWLCGVREQKEGNQSWRHICVGSYYEGLERLRWVS